MTNDQLLKYALNNNIINIAAIEKEFEMIERAKYLESHKQKIYVGKDGRWCTYLYGEEFPGGRRAIRKRTREELEDALIKFYKDKESNKTFNDLYREWIDSRIRYGEISNGSYDRYERDFNRYFSKSAFGKRYISTITESELEDFIKKKIKDDNLTYKCWSNMRILIAGVFKYAKKNGYTKISISQFLGDLVMSSNIFRRVQFKDEDSVFNKEEIAMIKDYAYRHSDDIALLGILLVFKTGLRVGELCSLKYSDFCDNILYVSRTEINYNDENGRRVYEVREWTKGRDGSRKVYIDRETNDLVELIRSKCEARGYISEYLFIRNNKRMHISSFGKKIIELCDKLHINRRSMHKARKTYITELFNAGVDEMLIIKQAGHTDITTTKRYYRFNNRTDEEASSIIQSAIIAL